MFVTTMLTLVLETFDIWPTKWMTSLSRATAMGYINETRKIEDTFKSSDRCTEEIEDQLVDEEEEVDSVSEEVDD